MDTEQVADFGGRMKRLREERGVSLRKIADTTKIAASALEALERNDISRLPGGIFSRAFVRAYAEEIGADPEATVREFLERFPQESLITDSPDEMRYEMATRPPSSAGRMVVIVAAVAVLLVVLLFWALFLRQ